MYLGVLTKPILELYPYLRKIYLVDGSNLMCGTISYSVCISLVCVRLICGIRLFVERDSRRSRGGKRSAPMIRRVTRSCCMCRGSKMWGVCNATNIVRIETTLLVNIDVVRLDADVAEK